MLSRLTTQAIRLYSQRNLATLPSSFVNRSRSNLAQPLFKHTPVHGFKTIPYSLLHTVSVNKANATELLKEETTIEPIEEKKRFDSIDTLQLSTQKAIQRIFKYQEMSSVQEAVLSRLPNQDDMFVKAKTGTGKTLAFLIAALETAVAGQKPTQWKHFDGASILIISPTRELASQIADEANKLTAFYPFKVHCLVGGESKRRQISNLERQRADIIVATPGRLYDMLSSVPRFKKMCQNLKVLVLDEADQLLDMGFKQELQNILTEIPEKRQTMLFSATISPEIRKNLGDFALSPDYKLIDTVGENEVHTHMHVKQGAIVAPYQKQFALIHDALNNKESAQSGKVIVFLPTTKATMLYAQIFKKLLPDRDVYELHSKKTQSSRSTIAQRFRKSSKGSILFTSDVSARGVDYPGVSLVVQVGVPSTREQYIHRLGRTGRAGKDGEGLIFLAPFEKKFLKTELSDLPIEQVNTALDEVEEERLNNELSRVVSYVDHESVREMYTAYLGYYAGRLSSMGMNRRIAVDEANNLLDALGVQDKPHLSERFLAQIGIGSSREDGGFQRRNNFRGGNFERKSFNRREDSFDRRNYNKRDDGFNRRNSFKEDRFERKSFSREDRFPRDNKFERRSSFGEDKSQRQQNRWSQRGSSRKYE
ncbi:DEAD-domain-containing protein [Rhizopus microsporus var. microsporus]|uniref:ATP-dependent RNA helicase n=2 Tax=Rhizopus microsporus TaxID=58291 RepID=A0A2G4SNN6_RHIZD|nr:DEAD-domain-containing protein [Rhizopus microsporus ATCC 52813]ORE03109.1 DEAD-domain-containing protein [Rhizopus microsporus var. microsporus]PHZ10397.1 DEAD-domain-containing protein [Rhizopus microsporus ATCC 52813]